MVCNHCQDLISDYIDGALELGEQVSVERHLADCEKCRAVRDDLLQVVHFSRQLPAHAPSPALWQRIQSEIAEEPRPDAWARFRLWAAQVRSRHLNLSVPQLAASAAALVILVAIGVMAARDNAPADTQATMASMTQPLAVEKNLLSNPDIKQIEHRINQLTETVEQRKVSWDPELRVAFERNLLYVDQSLAECRHQLSSNPADEVSQQLMLDAYREKMRVLEGFAKF
jgi:hypothetical protein